MNTPKQAASLFLAANGYANLTGMVVRGNGVIFLPALLFASCVLGWATAIRIRAFPTAWAPGFEAAASPAWRREGRGARVPSSRERSGARWRERRQRRHTRAPSAARQVVADGDAGEGGAGGTEEVPCTELTDLAYVRRWGPGDGERTSYELRRFRARRGRCRSASG